MTLQEGDSIKTSSSGSAQLIYFDGAVSTVAPGTLLTIRHLSEDPVTKVRRVSEKIDFGEVRASTRDRNVQGSYHEISTSKISARTEQAGEMRVAYDEKKKDSRIDVFGGRVQVGSASKREEHHKRGCSHAGARSLQKPTSSSSQNAAASGESGCYGIYNAFLIDFWSIAGSPCR